MRREAGARKEDPSHHLHAKGVCASFGVIGLANHGDVVSPRALGVLDDLKLDLGALCQRPVTFTGDRREMHKDVLAAFGLDEAKAFVVVEPLHCTDSHSFTPPFPESTSIHPAANTGSGASVQQVNKIASLMKHYAFWRCTNIAH